MTFSPVQQLHVPAEQTQRAQGGGLTCLCSHRRPGTELELWSQPPSCKAQCNLKPEIPFRISVHFPHVASELRGQVGAIRISTHVLLGWRQMMRLIPLAPLVPAAETPRSRRTCAHSGRRGSSCRGPAAGEDKGGSPTPALRGGPSGPGLSELISPHAYGCHRD